MIDKNDKLKRLENNLNVYYNLYNGIILEKTLNENHAYKQTNRKAKRNGRISIG